MRRRGLGPPAPGWTLGGRAGRPGASGLSAGVANGPPGAGALEQWRGGQDQGQVRGEQVEPVDPGEEGEW